MPQPNLCRAWQLAILIVVKMLATDTTGDNILLDTAEIAGMLAVAPLVVMLGQVMQQLVHRLDKLI